MPLPHGTLQEFLEDLEPFFYRRSLLYVDVGAHTGEVFKKVLASRLRIREAHLVEPNPRSVELLKHNVEGLTKAHIISVHDVAMGSQCGTVRLRCAQSMTKVVDSDPQADHEHAQDPGTFIAPCRTLDDLSSSFSEKHIALLKIDVEGHEVEVLAGAEGLLASQAVDVIYVEAGMNPSGTQQRYFRDIDDIVLAQGYRLFRIYEQTHEWLEDSPFLRRVNLAYFSRKFAESNPFRLTRELFDARESLESAQRERDESVKRLEALEDTAASQAKALETEQQKTGSLTAERRELKQLLRGVKNDAAASVQRVAELETRVRAADIETTELKQRMSIVVQAHQTQLLELAQERQTQRDLEKHLAIVQESAHAATRRIGELELQTNSVSAERDELAQRLAELSERHEAQSKALTELERRLREADAELSGLRDIGAELHDLRERLASEDLKRKRLSASRRSSEAMAREVFALYEALYRRERFARCEAMLSQAKELRTRGQLSYRLGSALVTNAQSPRSWLKMPSAVGRAYTGFRLDARKRVEEPPPELIEVLGPVPGGLPLRNRWDAVRILDGEAREVWARAFCVKPDATVGVQYGLGPAGPHPVLAARSGPDATHAGPSGPLSHADLRAGVAVKLADVPASSGNLDFWLHRTGGVPAIVQLELRRAGERDSAGTNAHVPSTPPTRAHEKRDSDGATGSGRHGSHAARTPATKQRNPIRHAHAMIGAGRFAEGIQFALDNASDVERPAIELLKANYLLQDEHAWLDHVNRYARQFGIARIELLPEGPARYFRLSAPRERKIETGPVVSVIMPAFNAEKTLEFAARSVLNQTWEPLELIIVDDASEDSTWTIARRLASEDGRVKLFRSHTNTGPYVAKNLGLMLAGGLFVTGHDADDWAHPERIERHVEAMLREGGRVRASLTKMLRLTSEGEFSHIGKNTPNVDDGVLQTAFISCMLETRLLRDCLGFWDSVRFGADSELISRARSVLGEGGLVVYRQLSMLCLSSSEGLTADPEHFSSRHHGMSPTRMQYKEMFTKWHDAIEPTTAYLPFPHRPRKFEAPAAALVPDDVIGDLKAQVERVAGVGSQDAHPVRVQEQERRADVCIVTDLSFPGGNASSTLDEVRTLLGAGATVRLLHCPRQTHWERGISQRYSEFIRLCDDCRAGCDTYQCEVLIARHPVVVCTPTFRRIAESIEARAAVVVVNNSRYHTDGKELYSLDDFARHVAAIRSPTKAVYPLGPAIREELLASSLGERVEIAPIDWLPTFSADAFPLRAPRPMAHPIVLGRHGRDGAEKWLEDAEQLRLVYPESPDFEVRILGGATCVHRVVGAIPGNWTVLPFGSVDPAEFLGELDAFVYFPHSNLVEGFGRTVMEAIFVGVPCVLPARLARTFDRVAFCCEPIAAIPAVRRIEQSHRWCATFVQRARAIAVAQQGSAAVLRRLRGVSSYFEQRIAASDADASAETTHLDTELEGYRRWVCTGEGDAGKYTDGSELSAVI
ncbi:MAG: FkbM family methyltransferase [Polyangiaceae bacterium]|nr:FkbM family methyltransferase [Polyangiaceae bacterium]